MSRHASYLFEIWRAGSGALLAPSPYPGRLPRLLPQAPRTSKLLRCRCLSHRRGACFFFSLMLPLGVQLGAWSRRTAGGLEVGFGSSPAAAFPREPPLQTSTGRGITGKSFPRGWAAGPRLQLPHFPRLLSGYAARCRRHDAMLHFFMLAATYCFPPCPFEMPSTAYPLARSLAWRTNQQLITAALRE
jgi:hypothetical protein